jgi:hypothetical protein
MEDDIDHILGPSESESSRTTSQGSRIPISILHQQLPAWKIAGLCLMILGSGLVLYFLFIFDTRAPQTDINNFGLLSTQQNEINLGIGLALLGGIFMVVDAIKQIGRKV